MLKVQTFATGLVKDILGLEDAEPSVHDRVSLRFGIGAARKCYSTGGQVFMGIPGGSHRSIPNKAISYARTFLKGGFSKVLDFISVLLGCLLAVS